MLARENASTISSMFAQGQVRHTSRSLSAPSFVACLTVCGVKWTLMSALLRVAMRVHAPLLLTPARCLLKTNMNLAFSAGRGIVPYARILSAKMNSLPRGHLSGRLQVALSRACCPFIFEHLPSRLDVAGQQSTLDAPRVARRAY